jgi:acyl carrier protein
MPQLPLTLGGKIDRAALPPPPPVEHTAEFVLPRTPLEELLVDLWKEVLHVEKAGIHDNFFELGGHSLLAAQLVSRIREHLQIDLPLRSVFDHPTVAETATILENMIIDEVEELSEEEALRLLRQKSASA